MIIIKTLKKPIDAINHLYKHIEYDLKINSKLESNLKLEFEVERKPGLTPPIWQGI